MSEIAALRVRADNGEADAMTAFGKVLLVGDENRPPNIPAGAHYISRAAEAGDAEAMTQHAALVAGGIANRPDWDQALDWLERAAAAGFAPAQDQLRFMAGHQDDDFRALRRAIDVAALLKPPQAKVEIESPRIATARGLMTAAECARAISWASSRLTRAMIYDEQTGGEALADERTNTKADMKLTDIDVPFVMIQARMSAMLGLPVPWFERANILHYDPGQRFTPHYDFLDERMPGPAKNVAMFGQRIVTLLVYLNDDYTGGETDFPDVRYRFRGKTGDALMFGNVTPNGAPDARTLHAGLAPVSGKKWLLSQWVRNRAIH